VNLVINWHPSANKARQEEYSFCLQANLDNKFIDLVVVVLDKSDYQSFKSIEYKSFPNNKLRLVQFNYMAIRQKYRPTFQDMFAVANSYVADNTTISIIANSDIVFPDAGLIARNTSVDSVMCLTRYELHPKTNETYIHNWGVDAWVFEGHIKPNICSNYFMGQLGCDWLICECLYNSGYKPFNPSLDIQTIHVHESAYRTYNKPQTKLPVLPFEWYIAPQHLGEEPKRVYKPNSVRKAPKPAIRRRVL